MRLWIGLAHFRPDRNRNPDVGYAGSYQFVGGPATDAATFRAEIAQLAEQDGFVLVELDDLETVEQYRIDGRVGADLAEFVEGLEETRALLFGPGHAYENDD